MKKRVWLGGLLTLVISLAGKPGEGLGAPKVSDATETCLTCHVTIHPGIVADWEKSVHAKVTPEEALKKEPRARKVSATRFPEDLRETFVGCAECHTLNSERHKDTFEHNGFTVHVIVTPEDCTTCHPTEARQYEQNLMSFAHINLNNNPVYHHLADTVNGVQSFENGKLAVKPPDEETHADSCFYCHGTEVRVEGLKSKDTDMGKMEFPVLTGWPNQGVGRINPDGSKGSCAACHTRHQFAIEMARKPYTCSECHKGPDVPAYRVYEVSKHGNLFSSLNKDWNFKEVPWRVGKDFAVPTCAVCHVSLTVTESNEVIAERTHRMNDRIPWRIMGLIYAHAHPQVPNTSIIKNKAGLPLPTELTGEPVSPFLISAREQEERNATLQKVCLSCHSEAWVKGQFERFENTIRTTNELTLAATKIMLEAWSKGAAKGLAQNDSLFNEAIEKKWVEQWLFYGNSTRFASAMAGADYGVFANGRWYLNKNLQEMVDWLEFKLGDTRLQELRKELDAARGKTKAPPSQEKPKVPEAKEKPKAKNP
jgi:hydroxylamine dehydrogenase